MSIRVDEARFEELVDDALDSVPDALFEACLLYTSDAADE